MDPLVNERPGDIGAITGVSSKNDLDTFDNVYGAEEQEEAVEAAGEEVVEAQPEPEPVDEEGEEEPEPSILQQFYADQRPKSEESELTRLRQEKARLEGLLEGRIHALEDQLRGAAQPQPEPEDDNPLRSPVVRATLDALREEDPSKYEAALVELATQRAESKVRADLEALRSKIDQREQSQTLQAQQTAYQQQVLGVLADIKDQGGVQADIISDLETNAANSLLGRKIAENPYIMLSRQGIRGAVAEIESELRAHAARRGGVGQVSGREVSAGGGKASRRGVSLNEKPKEMTFEEQVIADIESTSTPTQRLFGGR